MMRTWIDQHFRVSVDLKDLAPEVTHNLWRDVQNGDGRINILVTISGTTRGDSPSNLLNYEQELDKLQSQWIERYVSDEIVTVSNAIHSK